MLHVKFTEIDGYRRANKGRRNTFAPPFVTASANYFEVWEGPVKNTVRWDHLTWPQIKAMSEQKAIVLIPIGSIEQHGPHLPVGCDSILATAISERIAAELADRGKPCIVAPTLTVANSMHHMGFPGSMTLDLSTYASVLSQYCECIAGHGFKRIVLINGHGGNTNPSQAALVGIIEKLGFPVYFTGYWTGSGETVRKVLETQEDSIHACEGETSLMLAIDESLVDPIYSQTRGDTEGGHQLGQPRFLSAYRRFDKYTKNGVIGNSYAATKEKGEQMVTAFVETIVGILENDALWETQ